MKDTSWNNVSAWYDEYLSGEDTYQAKVLLPNLARLIPPRPGMRLLDLGCGSGFFSGAFGKAGAAVTGVDTSADLLAKARERIPNGVFHQTSADNLAVLPPASFDVAIAMLSLQNIKDVKGVFAETKRVLKDGGRLGIVLNHPGFRIPKASAWGFDEAANVQYRRLDAYLSERETEILMNPGGGQPVTTVSFHRPLQYYFKLLANAGFSVTRLEEWISHKESGEGPRKAAEDKARKEFPLFLYLEAKV